MDTPSLCFHSRQAWKKEACWISHLLLWLLPGCDRCHPYSHFIGWHKLHGLSPTLKEVGDGGVPKRRAENILCRALMTIHQPKSHLPSHFFQCLDFLFILKITVCVHSPLCLERGDPIMVVTFPSRIYVCDLLLTNGTWGEVYWGGGGQLLGKASLNKLIKKRKIKKNF